MKKLIILIIVVLILAFGVKTLVEEQKGKKPTHSTLTDESNEFLENNKQLYNKLDSLKEIQSPYKIEIVEAAPYKLNLTYINDIKYELPKLLKKARKELYFEAYYLKESLSSSFRRELEDIADNRITSFFVFDNSAIKYRNFLKTLKASNNKLRYSFYDVKHLSNPNQGLLHTKAFTIDDKYSYIGSSNFSYTGFHENREIGAIIQDKSIAKTLKNIILNDYYTSIGEHKQSYIKEFNPTEFFFISESAPKEINSVQIPDNYDIFIYMLNRAKKRIYINMYFLTDAFGRLKEMRNLILEKLRQNVEVKILVDSELLNDFSFGRPERQALNLYRKHRAKIKEIDVKILGRYKDSGNMHAKYVVVDDLYFMLGSCNFTKSGFFENREIDICGKSRPIAGKLKRIFETDFSKAKKY